MDKSVYDLITNLCERYIDKNNCILYDVDVKSYLKRLRSKSFEFLIKKQHTSELNSNPLEGSNNSICHLLAWHYTLKNEFNEPEKAEALRQLICELEQSNFTADPIINNIILFLLRLRNSTPESKDKTLKQDIFNKVTLKHKLLNNKDFSAIPYDVYQDHKFILPKNIISIDVDRLLSQYSVKTFTSKPKNNLSLSRILMKPQKFEKVLHYKNEFNFNLTTNQIDPVSNKNQLASLNNEHDDGYSSPGNLSKQELWNLALKSPVNNKKNWECLYLHETEKQLPFAGDSGPETFQLLLCIIEGNKKPNELVPKNKIIDCKYFIKCVKYMLVGMSSEIFKTNKSGSFYLVSYICVKGLSQLSLETYCCDLLFCGDCYRFLNNLCTTSSNEQGHGFVYKKLCESVKRYLEFYRVAILSLSDSSSLLLVLNKIKPLKYQLEVLIKLCKVAAQKNENIAEGAKLLNYMYEEILKSFDNNLTLVLYSIFYPCCQIYFSRFVQRWLFEGILIDPYEEFIIKAETTYTNTRARSYWTRSFSIRPNSVPEFLLDLKNDILQCGKAMNLLKLCNPDAALHTHIMSRPLPLIPCCLSPVQSERLKQNIDCYYIEMASMCGPRISLYHNLRDRYGCEENSAFVNLVEKKRALVYKEIELKKQQAAEEKVKHKRKIFNEMKEQMELAAEQKKKIKEEEWKQELMIARQNAQMEELRYNLVKEETKFIITYYNNLIEAVEKRKNSIEIRKQKLLDTSLDIINISSNENESENASDEIFLSPKSTMSEIVITTSEEDENKNMDSAKSTISEIASEEITPTQNLDEVNANLANVEMLNQINENYLAAQRTRAKVLNLEFNADIMNDKLKSKEKVSTRDMTKLTEAQKNKLKVLSSEFDIFYDTQATTSNANIINNQSDVNINNNTTEESTQKINKTDLDLASPGHEDVMNLTHKKTITLKLPKITELNEKSSRSSQIELSIPMSIDSTPNTEYSMDFLTPSSAKLSLNTDIFLESGNLDSALMTASSNFTDDGFHFPTLEPKKFAYDQSVRLMFVGKNKIRNITENIPQSIQPMQISKEEIQTIKNGNLKTLLYQSVEIPLKAQIKLVNSEIIKYFINDQNFFSHLNSLRNYYLFMDGEFCRSLTEGLFTKLYESKQPRDLLNLHSLQALVETALFASSKNQENGDRLSFIVKYIPKIFDISNADVFDCLSLSYRINWPLNILLPFDTIEKYDLIFKYLLKLHYVSWIQQKMYQDLKNSRKEYGIDENLLLNSPQYHKIQLYRHIMTHFVQTLQNYTVCEVLQTSWEKFENNLKVVNILDELYSAHIIYIKTIMFRCLLHKKCAQIMKVIQEIFVVIIKFYNYLRSRAWNLKENDIYYTHPNFRRLEDIFNKFQEFTKFVFHVGNKIARVGYQPDLIQMLDMLNVNDYYINMQKSSV